MRLALFALLLTLTATDAFAAFENKAVARLRWLDKITAQTEIVDLAIGETVHYGDLSVRVRACRQQDPLEGAENAAFLQIWEKDQDGEPQWVFSGWMFGSSPGLSAMDHPIYDVWVLECRDKAGDDETPAKKATIETIKADDTEAAEEEQSEADVEVESDGETP